MIAIIMAFNLPPTIGWYSRTIRRQAWNPLCFSHPRIIFFALPLHVSVRRNHIALLFFRGSSSRPIRGVRSDSSAAVTATCARSSKPMAPKTPSKLKCQSGKSVCYSRTTGTFSKRRGFTIPLNSSASARLTGAVLVAFRVAIAVWNASRCAAI